MPVIPAEDGGFVLDETEWMEPYTFENKPRPEKGTGAGTEKERGDYDG